VQIINLQFIQGEKIKYPNPDFIKLLSCMKRHSSLKNGIFEPEAIVGVVTLSLFVLEEILQFQKSMTVGRELVALLIVKILI